MPISEETEEVLRLLRRHFPVPEFTTKNIKQLARLVDHPLLGSRMTLEQLEYYFNLRDGILADTSWEFRVTNLRIFLWGWRKVWLACLKFRYNGFLSESSWFRDNPNDTLESLFCTADAFDDARTLADVRAWPALDYQGTGSWDLGRFLHAFRLGLDPRQLGEKFTAGVRKYFKHNPDLYFQMQPKYPVALWTGFRAEEEQALGRSLERFHQHVLHWTAVGDYWNFDLYA